MDKEKRPNDTMEQLPYRFIESMIDAAGEMGNNQKVAEVLRNCSCVHYRILDMDSILSDFIGNLEKFIDFIENQWGWKISYDPERGIIEADENKPFCVCPLVEKGSIKNPLLCHCSEGFAKSMFSKVVGKPVCTEVVRSVLRGDASCVYRIKIME